MTYQCVKNNIYLGENKMLSTLNKTEVGVLELNQAVTEVINTIGYSEITHNWVTAITKTLEKGDTTLFLNNDEPILDKVKRIRDKKEQERQKIISLFK